MIKIIIIVETNVFTDFRVTINLCRFVQRIFLFILTLRSKDLADHSPGAIVSRSQDDLPSVLICA